MHLDRNLCIAVTFILVLLSSQRAALSDTSPPQPNVILIYADDLGYGDLACFGSKVNATPHIDKLATQGMRFTQYYSASSVCSPSRGALLTGCYPPRIGFDVFNQGKAWVLFPGYAEGFQPDEMIMPEFFKARGYATAHVGKWHCGDQPEHLPTRHGFDSYYGLPYSNDMAIMPRRAKSVPLPLLRNEEVIQVQPRQAPLIERYTEESIPKSINSTIWRTIRVRPPMWPRPIPRSSRNSWIGCRSYARTSVIRSSTSRAETSAPLPCLRIPGHW